MRYDVITLGSATVDLFCTTETSLSDVALGDKILIDTLEKHTGGGGTNAAVSLAKMGLSVAYLGKIGHDFHGKYIHETLSKSNVNVLCAKDCGKRTALSIIINYSGMKDRVIYTYKGAADEFMDSDYTQRELSSARWIYMASLMGKSARTANQIASFSQKAGISLLFNPSLYMVKSGPKKIMPLLRAATILILNREEAQALTGRRLEFATLCRSLVKLGPKHVIVTLGKEGVVGYCDKQLYFAKSPKIIPTNTTGAGDAFASGFLAGVIKGCGYKRSIELGMANAVNVIQHIGAKTGLLTYKQALKTINTYKISAKAE